MTGVNFSNIKLNNRIAYLLNTVSVVILLGCLITVIVRHFFTVDKIIINGELHHITPVQLSYVAHNRLHGTFFTLDISELKAEFAALPWVRHVSLKRHFPHTIEVSIEEYKAVARLGGDDLLAEDGEIFDGADNNPLLPTFYIATPDTAMVLAKYQQIQTVLAKHHDTVAKLWLLTPKITRFTTRNNLAITICDNDLTAKLGILNNYWDRIYALNPKLISVNLCYKNALAINSSK
jgi:cell division protein FtsQ